MRSWGCLLLLIAACGDDGGPRGPIEVRVENFSEMPVADIDVVLHDNAGEVVITAKTDAAGTVMFEPTANLSMVTVLALDASGPSRNIETRMGIERGDTLHFIVGAYPQPPAFTAEIGIAVPANPPASTTNYWIDFGCEAFGAPIAPTFTHQLSNDCRRPNTNEIDVIIYAQNGDTRLAYAVMPNVPLAATGPTALAFPGGWRTDWLTFQAAYTGVPTSATQYRTGFSVQIGGRYFFTGSPLERVDSNGITRTHQYVNGVATRVQHSLELQFGDGMRHGTTLYGRALADTGSDSLDAERLPPAISSVNLGRTETPRPTVNWTSAGTHEMAAAGFANIFWSTPEEGVWSIQFPPDLDDTSITVPALPDSLAAFRPPADGSIDSDTASVSFQWSSFLPSFEVSRQGGRVIVDGDYELMQTIFPGY